MIDETIKQLEIWEMLSKKEQRTVLDGASVETVPRGRVLFHEGERGKRAGLLAAGLLLLVQPVAGHEDVVLHVARPGDLFGESLLVAPKTAYRYRLETIEKSTVAWFPVRLLSGIIRQNPKVAAHFCRMAMERMQQAEARLLEVRYQTVEQRIRALLWGLTETDSRQLLNGEVEISLRLPHRLVAQLCVTSRQSVTIILLELKKQGIIRYNRHHLVVRKPGSL